ncbi:hypothetical protein [Leeuwenhoekiella sp. ZYFB001]|uniref:hypothetical protein n=1 Tax=Leeuwenhoekiella sp. ZYFB001 TaxID=2719912 RepID=UPI00142F605F|nr:hypothetical protein [Leeuwenhoekiella sp. ZYFB001]
MTPSEIETQIEKTAIEVMKFMRVGYADALHYVERVVEAEAKGIPVQNVIDLKIVETLRSENYSKAMSAKSALENHKMYRAQA